MNSKDIISRDIIKRLAVDIAQILLKLEVKDAEIIETQYQRIEERRADMVAKMEDQKGAFILHVEVQNDNQSSMPHRMLRYRTEISLTHPKIDIRQYLIYIGKAPLNMPAGLQQSGLNYRYTILDMHTVDCQKLIAMDDPDALVLAILCDFKDRPEQEVVHYILKRLKELNGDNESRYRESLKMVEILSTNRKLERLIEEEEKMLTQVEQTKLPSYRIGMQQGKQEGKQEGEGYLLLRQIKRLFGQSPDWVEEKITQATTDQIEQWADNILDATTIEDVFR